MTNKIRSKRWAPPLPISCALALTIFVQGCYDFSDSLDDQASNIAVAKASLIEGPNIALNKPATASSELRPGSDAVDDNPESRWESAHGVSPSWLTIDLESNAQLTGIEIDWEAANPATYQIQASNDNNQWNTLATYNNGLFGNRTDELNLTGNYRYVRVYATQPSPNNAWGYSIFDLRLYGSFGDTPPPTDPDDPTEPQNPTDPDAPVGLVPLYLPGTALEEVIQYTEADGTLVTLMGARPTERHARERGEPWEWEDVQPGRYLTFPPFYFQNRSFGLEIRDNVAVGGGKVEFWLHVSNGSFMGTTFSLFRNVQDPNVTEFGWALNYGFNNANEGGQPLCHAGKRECMMEVDSNWRTSPHSPLKVGDKIELAPAPRLLTPVLDGGGERYYSFEQLYVVGVGMRPWYGIAPNLDSEPLPDETLLGGQASISYNYSEEPMRMFQQMANNIGIDNTQRFVEGRRLFHTSFISGIHSEFPNENPVFSAHINQAGPRFNEERCIGCHTNNGRSNPVQIGSVLTQHSVLTGAANDAPDPLYGFNVQRLSANGSNDNYAVSVKTIDQSVRYLNDGTAITMHKPSYEFAGPVPEYYSVRQAPQVIGLGLLEAIPEARIVANVDTNDANGDGVIGLAHHIKNPETGDTQLGRFGWKATKISMRHQTGEALLQDMGVTSPVYPLQSCQFDETTCHENVTNTEVSENELNRLQQYLALIGVPAQRSLRSGYPDGIRVSIEHDVNPPQIANGQQLFEQAQCTACHKATFVTGNSHPFAELRNQTIHPYTDLLLHDMGADLADSLTQGDASPSMWRTPPLWGLGSLKFTQGNADNVRYLHDGRAQSLEEAILWHGGEATQARENFKNFTAAERNALKAFLESL